MLRNPTDRTYSQFNFHHSFGVEQHQSFIRMLDNYASIDHENMIYHSWYSPSHYIEISLYSSQIERFLKFFDLNQIHFIIFENFIKNQNEEIKNL